MRFEYFCRLFGFIALNASVFLFSLTASCSRRWCQYRMMQCIDDSSAMTRWNSLQSLHGCVLKASSAPDDLVLQWNKQTGVCSIFHYQHVCRMMQASGARPMGGQSSSSDQAAVDGSVQQCSVYRAKSLASCDASLLNAQLVGVWLAGGSNRFSNLVCQSGEPASSSSYRLESANLQWTEEGAQFDGHSSYALLNDSRFVSTDPSASFTWLMRLKREPRVQPFMEAVSCYNPVEIIGPHFWEYSAANQMFFSKASFTTTASNFLMYSNLELLPASRDVWIDVAVSVSTNASSSDFYFNSSFVGAINFNRWVAPWSSCFMVLVGRRFAFGGAFLKGVVRAVAIANASLTEEEVRDFFQVLP